MTVIKRPHHCSDWGYKIVTLQCGWTELSIFDREQNAAVQVTLLPFKMGPTVIDRNHTAVSNSFLTTGIWTKLQGKDKIFILILFLIGIYKVFIKTFSRPNL